MNEHYFEQICQFLRLQKQLGDQYDEWMARAGKRLGLSKPEADVLLFLVNNPQYNTARDVVANRALSKTYVSKAVEQLSERGFLRTEICDADRRLQFLRLLPAAAGPVQALRRYQMEFFQRLTDGLSPEDSAFLGRLFQRVQMNLDRIR